MIARRWKGWTEGAAHADAYVVHFETSVRPQLERTAGFLGATLERVQDDGGSVEIVVVTRWASLDAIRAFAGEDIEAAVVEPAARAVLADFEPRVRHIELADGEAFEHLELIDIPGEAAAHDPWFNETLTTVNDAVVRLGVVDGDFRWHKHDEQDEFFNCSPGSPRIATGDGSAPPRPCPTRPKPPPPRSPSTRTRPVRQSASRGVERAARDGPHGSETE